MGSALNDPDQNKPSPLMKVREIADFLQLKPKTVRRYTEAGIIPVVKIGASNWRYHPLSVLAALTVKKGSEQ